MVRLLFTFAVVLTFLSPARAQEISIFEQIPEVLKQIPPAVRDPTQSERNEMESLDIEVGAAVQRGDLEAALTHADDLVHRFEATWGPKHPIIGIALATRAFALAQANQVAMAEVDLRRNVELHETALGPDHPLTFEALQFLANGLAQIGNLDLALAQSVQNADRAHAAGPETLGYEFQALMLQADINTELRNDLGEIAALRPALDIVEKANGELDTGTFSVLNRLGRLLRKTGNYREAERIQRESLGRYQSLNGKFHPDTANAKHELGITLTEAGEAEAAVYFLEEAAEIREQWLGSTDPLTLVSRAALVDALLQTPRAKEGERVAKDLFLKSEKLPGDSAELMFSLMARYPTALRMRGKQLEAINVSRSLIARIENTLGPNHEIALVRRYELAQLYYLSGHLDDARRMHQDIYETRLKLYGIDHNNTLLSLWSLATVDLNSGNPSAALDTYWEIDRRFSHIQNIRGATYQHLRSEMAEAHMALGQIETAVEELRQVVAALEDIQGSDHPDTLTAKSHLAEALDKSGNYETSETLQREVLIARTRLLGSGHRDTLASLSSLASRLTARDRSDEAIPLLESAIARARSDLGDTHADVLALVQLLGESLHSSERNFEALGQFQEAAAGLSSLFGPTEQRTLNAKRGIAETLLSLNRPSEAESVLREVVAAKIEIYGKDDLSTLDTQVDLVTSLLDQGRATEALPIIERAAKLLADQSNGDDTRMLYAWDRLAYTYLKLDRPVHALVPARRLVTSELGLLVSSQETFQSEIRLQEKFAADAGMLFAVAAHRAIEAYPEDDAELRAEAFLAVQAASQSGAAAATARAAARIAAKDKNLSVLVRQWEKSSASREYVDKAFVSLASSANDIPAQEELSKNRSELDDQLKRLTTRLQNSFPEFFELSRPAPLSEGELRGLGNELPILDEDEVLILLAPGWDQTKGLVWAISRDSAAWARLTLTGNEISKEIKELHQSLDGGGRTRGANAERGTFNPYDTKDREFGFNRARSHDLYQALFESPDIRATIADAKHWIIVPQGMFLSLPFNALVMAPPTGSDSDPEALRQTRWLGTTKSITISPMVSMLGARRRDAGTASDKWGTFFGIGDPDFRGTDVDTEPKQLGDARNYFSNRSADPRALRRLARLPGTRSEVLAMAEAFHAGKDDYLLGLDATESRLAEINDSGALAEANVILFATHGLIAGNFKGIAEPALALTPPVDKPVQIKNPDGAGVESEWREQRIDDGLLTASEAARLDLRADWVILSACDTAGGAELDAAGLTGLARSFFFAGAQSILVSHWKVRDDVAARLTTDAVIRRINNPGLPKSAALSEAMRAVLVDRGADLTGRSFAHPAAWAPFQVISVGAN